MYDRARAAKTPMASAIVHAFSDYSLRAQAVAKLARSALLSCSIVSFPKLVIGANTVPFTPVQTLEPKQAISVDQEEGELDFNNWVNRGMTIRTGDSIHECLGNLTVALDLVGKLNEFEYAGASGALSLLPTAGALLGAPTREMWIVYKLVPIAGLLSMFLSLGGSITPSNVGDYDPDEPFSYGGFMPTNAVTATGRVPKSRPTTIAEREDVEHFESETGAQRFAEEVRQRADDDTGASLFLGIWSAMVAQLCLVIGFLIPMYYAQRGSVITWWCRTWPWMWFWYSLVTVVAIFDNLVAAPFTKSWTIRVSRTPSGLVMDESSRKITDPRYPNALEYIKSGPVMNQRLRVSHLATSYPRTCFYVVISVQGISPVHAAAQVFAKAASVAVFAFGTALFASATLMSISIALMVLCLTLPAGVAGRVIAMWIVSSMSQQNKPILHKMVRSEEEAGKYFHAIAELDLQLEIKGHVIVNGSIVTSRHSWFTPATYIGLLAKPFDVVSLATKTTRGLGASTSHGTFYTGSMYAPSNYPLGPQSPGISSNDRIVNQTTSHVSSGQNVATEPETPVTRLNPIHDT
ncbi:hypothetical protein PGQ11_010662 [Apiospora arundinis]|uniref:Uncharacterized protein n=1 Tax=Apiospora arundinis TaxID=335852 RepID=A0ABR2IAB8_9PEZI